MSDRATKWRATRHVRELALFADKRFEVVREFKNEEFESPLGYKGKNGYEVRNIDTNETFKVGKATLARMAKDYEAVTLPAPKKRGRPKKSQFAAGGFIQGPGSKGDDSILIHLSHGEQRFTSDEVRNLYDQELLDSVNKNKGDQENGNEPGAHPVNEQEPDEDDRSGSLAGPTYGNPNEDIHYEG